MGLLRDVWPPTAAVLLCAAGWLSPDLAAAPPPGAAERHEEAARAVRRATLAIVSFARWPGDPPLVRLCVLGVTPYAGSLLEARSPWPRSRRRVSVRQRAPVDAAGDCDAIYLGRLPDAELQALHQRIAGLPTLTISEQAGACGGALMFCLDIRAPQVGLSVNPPVLARSGVRVHPRVLQLALREAPVP